MSSVKVGQIGCGYWGPNLLRAFLANSKCQVKTVAELASDRRNFITKNFSNVNVIEDYRKILDDQEIAAVAIVTPAETHFSLIKECLAAGKHVFVEKPLATSVEEAAELLELSKSKRALLMVGHLFLYHPPVQYLKEQIKKEIGDPYYFYSKRLNLGIVRKDVNAWWNLAPHDISILLYLMDGKLPEKISAFGMCYLQPNIEDVVFAVLTWENNVAAHIHVSWLDPSKVRETTVVGSKKMVVYDDVSDDKITIYNKGISIQKMDFDEAKGSAFVPRFGDILLPRIEMKEPLKVEVDHFIDCILQNKPPLTGPEHGLDVVAILEAGQRSLKNGGRSECIYNQMATV